MFERLDDPNPPELTHSLREGVRARIRRRRARRLAAGGVLTSVLLAIGAVAVRAATRLDDVRRLDVAGLEPDGDATSTILLVGTDAGLDDRPADAPYADAMVALHVDQEAGTLRLMSVPRDLQVPAPDGGATRLATLYRDGDPSRLVEAITSELDLAIDHVAVLDVTGFEDLVHLLGGVRVDVAAPMRDRNAGLLLEEPGCTTLTGEQALALVRARHVELIGGSRSADPTGDAGRILRQQVVLLSALEQVRSTVPNPFSLDDLAGWVAEHVAVDSAMDRSTLLSLLRFGVGLDADRIETAVLPTATAVANGAVTRSPTDDAADVTGWLQDGTRSDAAAPPEEEGAPLLSTC